MSTFSTPAGPAAPKKEVDVNAIPLYSWFLLLFLSLMWGSSYILIKKALGIFTPMQVGALRLSISGLAFLPYFLLKWRRVDWSKFRWLLLVGITGTGLPSILFPLAQTHISSSVSGILNSMTPLFTMLIGILAFKAPMIWAKAVGVLLGLLGAVLLILGGSEGEFGGNFGYGLFIVLATLCYATSTNTVAFKLKGISSLVISGVSFTIVGIPAIILALSLGIPEVIATHPEAWTGLGYITILALGSTVLASVLFFHLIQIMGPIPSSMVSYIVPIVALLWGFVDGEFIGLIHFMGMAMIFIGVYLSRRR
ncbi:DMT family transporter [Flavilitoribacter nigricans]|uniref:EamA family transporter n=1 Tax=Flavilitoribacter nigricans (strain ATCC 23147 / DSM 23189 / NBRC 102662 / NCIMB 1420 / SS-2) TaxID=1122177 RepID=A0A2D0N3E5_FLAN2|nr:DMT family transporter [Flavilitoribacter nigricans]PHN03025.1 EamA family transporter [Flavilitoribacter nigricans DSM 23189 = NBRC 102662]